MDQNLVGMIFSLLTLTIMEIVLGIDNVIFISIIADKIDPKLQARVRRLGILLALIVRIILLALISQLTHLKTVLFTVFDLDFGVKHLILIFGGLFLIYKSTTEIHHALEGEDETEGAKGPLLSPWNAISQIILIDVVFSFDSILAAVGLSNQMYVMVLAVLVSMSVMLMSAKKISNFINDHPTVKMLALSFLMTIGVLLVAEGLHQDIPKGYIYYSLGFSLVVELLNLRMKSHNSVKLKTPKLREEKEEK